MIITSLLVKVLVLAEAFLDFFVTVNTDAGEYMTGFWSNCPATVTQYSGSMTDCGSAVITVVTNLIPTLLQLFQGILGGLVAVQV